MKKIKAVSSCLSIAVFLFSGFLVHGSSAEGSFKKVPHRVPGVTAKVRIDGILNEEVWQEALVLKLDYEVEPGENIEPPVKSEVLLAYGPGHLYVAFRAYDPYPQAIRARFTDRDHIWEDDYVGIILDTFNDSRRSYDFYCNPYGIQADQIQGMIGKAQTEWDAIWDSAGRINEEGYVVEMAIPFSSLRFQRKGEEHDQVWGIDAVRSYPRNLSHLIGLFPRDRSNNCYMCQADKIVGFKGARPGKRLELDPTLSTIYTQERESFPEGKFVKKTGRVEPGLTARWGFTSNLTLSTALNPDFSHVEADAAQLDINTQFALFYQEKRPFFLEDASIFKSRFIPVHTRTIADPDWGVKVTGKEGANAIGFFSVQDHVTNLLFPGPQGSQSTSLGMNNLSSVLRYRRDIGKASNLGVVVTDRQGEDYFNRLAGIDGDLRITKRDRIMFQFIGTQTRYPAQVADDFNQQQGDFYGTAFDFVYSHGTEHIEFWGEYQQITPDFRSDLGFIPQAGFRYIDVGGGYIWRHNPGHWYTRLNIGTGYSIEKDHHDNLLSRSYKGWLKFNGPAQSFLNMILNIGTRSFLGIEFDDTRLDFDAGLRPSGSLHLRIRGIVGDQIDFANVQQGRRFMVNPIMQYNIGRHLFLGLDHIFERLNVEAGRLYTANISNVRLVYQFSRRAFLRTICQYVNYDYNQDLYSSYIEPKFRHFFSQVLFSYKINPQTVLFLGYSDDHYGDQDIPLTQNNRTFFLKIGYALIL